MRPKKPRSQSPTSCLQVDYYLATYFSEVRIITPLYSLHQIAYVRRDLQVLKTESQDAKSTQSAQHEQCTIEDVLPEETSEQEETSSDQDQDDEVVIQTPQFIQPSARHMQAVQPMYMPYIEGPKMDWTVNDSLYHRFLKWKIKCKNILDCELAMLSEARKCKKVVAWPGYFGMDQYVSWSLPPEDLCLEIIWNKFEEFFKPQINEVRARFDLLKSFRQGDMSVHEWYNAVQVQINLAKYPAETSKILHRDIFFFSEIRTLPLKHLMIPILTWRNFQPVN